MNDPTPLTAEIEQQLIAALRVMQTPGIGRHEWWDALQTLRGYDVKRIEEREATIERLTTQLAETQAECERLGGSCDALFKDLQRVYTERDTALERVAEMQADRDEAYEHMKVSDKQGFMWAEKAVAALERVAQLEEALSNVGKCIARLQPFDNYVNLGVQRDIRRIIADATTEPGEV